MATIRSRRTPRHFRHPGPLRLQYVDEAWTAEHRLADQRMPAFRFIVDRGGGIVRHA